MKFFWSRPSFRDVASAASHDIGARNAIEIFWSRPSFGDVASSTCHDIGAKNAIEIFRSRPKFGDVASAASYDIGARNAIEIFQVDQASEMLRVPLVTILAREKRLKFFEVDQRFEMLRVLLVTIFALEMRLKFFEVDQRLEMLRVPLVTILARKMRFKIFWSRPSFGDVASAASHHYWCEKCDWKFFQVDQAFEMLRVPLVTIFALEMRLNFFQVDQTLEMLRVPLFTILARDSECDWNFLKGPSFGDVASSTSHDIGARNAIENFWSRPTFGDVASAASHDIGARNAIEFFFKSTKLWRCCKCRQWWYLREKCDWKFFEVDQALESFFFFYFFFFFTQARPHSQRGELWSCLVVGLDTLGRPGSRRPHVSSAPRVPLVTILARYSECDWHFSKSTNVWRCCE